MNWGWKIAVGYSSFVLFILYMVYRASGVDFQLVTDDYYNKEMAFQRQMENADAARKAGHGVEVIVVGDKLAIHFNPFDNEAKTGGEVHFFRPSDQALDRIFDWVVDENGMMYVDRGEFVRGLYTFKLDAEYNGNGIYIEKPVFLP